MISISKADGQAVSKSGKDNDRIQQMITIITLSCDVKIQIDLSWRINNQTVVSHLIKPFAFYQEWRPLARHQGKIILLVAIRAWLHLSVQAPNTHHPDGQ